MFPPFPQENAHKKLKKLTNAIDRGELTLTQVTEVSSEREGNGIMLGALVCKNSCGREITLYAVSGIAKQLIPSGEFSLSDDEIIVPPLVSPQKIAQALSKNDAQIHKLTQLINEKKESCHVTPAVASHNLAELCEMRKKLTTESLQKVFDLYSFYCFDGKKITLAQIIKFHGGALPPTGTGDCCAPKLLSYAFEHNLQPLSMDEIFYGKNTKNKINGQSYPPCDERCGYILPYILGLEILYRDPWILVVNKQSGLLSVPGRTADKQDCIVTRMQKLFPETISQPSVHRLDMETSGLLVLAFTEEAHRKLNYQFSAGLVRKKYVALLEGVLNKAPGLSAQKKGLTVGRIQLKFRLDINNRPHQIYDEENGKLGITDWESLGTETYRFTSDDGVQHHFPATRVIYTPHTGRTHQLRLVSSDIHGFGLPIIGDTLYGNFQNGQRLMLHSFLLEFTHPVTGQKMHFECKADF